MPVQLYGEEMNPTMSCELMSWFACMRTCQCFTSYLWEHCSPNNTPKMVMVMMRMWILTKMVMI